MKSFLTALFCLFLAFPAAAHEFEVGDLEIVHPVALVSSHQANEAIGYFRIRNDSDESDRLLSVTAPETSEVIQIIILPVDEPGVAQQALSELDIPAKQETALTPTGTHLLFAKLKTPLTQDSSFPAVLTFEKAGQVSVIFNIETAVDKHAH